VLFEELRRGPRSVGELVAAVEISQPAVSQHLGVLRSAGLVTSRKAGQRRIYAIDRNGVAALRWYIESFWDAALEAYQAAAEQSSMEENEHE
jgi:DNA-binding transcriptional ArsR family regulator